MHLLTDANVFVPMVLGLRKMGHDIFDLKEEGLDYLSDPDVFRLAQDKGRILITMDLEAARRAGIFVELFACRRCRNAVPC